MRHDCCVSDTKALTRVPDRPRTGEKLVVVAVYLPDDVPQKMVGEIVTMTGWDPIIGDNLPRVKHRDISTEFWLTEWR